MLLFFRCHAFLFYVALIIYFLFLPPPTIPLPKIYLPAPLRSQYILFNLFTKICPRYSLFTYLPIIYVILWIRCTYPALSRTICPKLTRTAPGTSSTPATPSSSGKVKSRSRSKSPFRSFRWRTAKKLLAGSHHSDDEGITRAW